MEAMEKSMDKSPPPRSHKSVNPIRNHIRKSPPGEYKKPSIFYDNSIQYGRNRNQSLNMSISEQQNSLVLPSIKNGTKNQSNTKNTLKEMIQMMKIRKKTNKGSYEEESTIKSYPHKKGNGAPLSERYKKKETKRREKLATDQT